MRILITGAAGFLGSHLCDRFLPTATSDRHRQLHHRPPDNIAHLAGNPGFRFIKHDVTELHLLPARWMASCTSRSPASPIDYLELPIQTLKVGSLGTHKALGPGQGEGRALPARLHLRGLWRSAGAPAAGDVLGPRQPGRPARRLRRSQALRRGDDHGLPPIPRRRHAHRPHLQHLWPAHAAQRRPRRVELHRAGAARRAADGLRRRQQTRSFCYVDDVVEGIYRLFMSDDTSR